MAEVKVEIAEMKTRVRTTHKQVEMWPDWEIEKHDNQHERQRCNEQSQFYGQGLNPGYANGIPTLSTKTATGYVKHVVSRKTVTSN